MNINWKIVFVIILSLFFIKVLLETSLLQKSNKPLKINSTNAMLNNEQAHVKIKQNFRILLWTKWYGYNWFEYFNKGSRCKYNNCIVNDDRTNLQSFDAIVFHWFNINPKYLPEKVFDHQKWVLYNMEAPNRTAIGFDNIGLKKIDWMMTYRTDSDIYTPYGKVVECNRNWKQKYKFENKTKSIAWFVSNCKTPSNRESIGKKLGQYIDIDIYGKCGTLDCTKFDDLCIEMIAKRYKFYLSFENSICKDYVTEKAFHYMEYDIIPVVLGGANYSAIFPPNSYIDALNFTSVGDLAEYLKKVGSDERLYNSYFKWKNKYCIERVYSHKNMCELCEHLNKNYHKNKSYLNNEDIKKWWSDANCRSIQFNGDTIELVRSNLTRI